MNDREHSFIDTNILVYAHDREAGERNKIAKSLITSLWQAPYPPAISVQVLSELYVNLLKKKVDEKELEELIQLYLAFEVINNDAELFKDALEVRRRWKISFWDSCIIAAALRARATVLLSEDLQDGQKFDFVRVVNPFKPSISRM